MKHIVLRDESIHEMFKEAKQECLEILREKTGFKVKKISDEAAVEIMADFLIEARNGSQ